MVNIPSIESPRIVLLVEVLLEQLTTNPGEFQISLYIPQLPNIIEIALAFEFAILICFLIFKFSKVKKSLSNVVVQFSIS